MNNFQYYNPVEMIFGRGLETTVGEHVVRYGGTKVLMVHYGDPYIYESGLHGRIMDSLKGAGLEVLELTGVQPNPRVDLARKGIEICRKEGVDFLLAVGGGSAIDTAKCICFGMYYDGDVWDIYMDASKMPDRGIPLAAIPTIAASGSEYNCSSIISNDEGQLKRGAYDPIGFPKFAIYNPELLYTLPPKQTAAGIVDAISHLSWSYHIKQDHIGLQDDLTLSAIKALVDNGRIVMKNPRDYEARAAVLLASTFACVDILHLGSKQDPSSHHLEHELSAIYDVTHGVGLAIILPSLLRYLYKGAPDRFAKFGRVVFGIEENDDEKAALMSIDALEQFFREIGMPTHLREIGIGDEHFEQMADKVLRDVGPFGDIHIFDKESIIEMYRLCL